MPPVQRPVLDVQCHWQQWWGRCGERSSKKKTITWQRAKFRRLRPQRWEVIHVRPLCPMHYIWFMNWIDSYPIDNEDVKRNPLKERLFIGGDRKHPLAQLSMYCALQLLTAAEEEVDE